MPCASLQRMPQKFQEEPSDLETQLLELGFLCENENAVGQTTASFSYNAHGSMASMPHLSAMDWDFAEKLRHITRGTTEAYYNYDGNGIRTRKVVEKNGVVETRLYLGGFEIWRKTVNGVLDTERETLHVMDDKRRIAIVETLTVENGNRAAGPSPVQRYQLDNHLGSASLELDASANVISYEEYYPYGDTSYRAGRSASEVSQKRYRYTGKEKDEESSLYYCEQRYYAAHISRWVSTDPTWLEDGVNLYAYVHGNPVSGVDPSGMGTESNDEIKGMDVENDNKKENEKKIRDYIKAVKSIEKEASTLYKDSNERNSMISRLLRDYGGYTGFKWNQTSGSVDDDFRELIDRILPKAASEFRKHGIYDKIKDPRTGVELDLSHMHASLSGYLYNEKRVIIREEWASWAGDMLSYSEKLAEADEENKIPDLYSYAENIGTTKEEGMNFSLNDLIADVDARNISVLVKQKGMSVADAIEQYYLGGGVQKRFTNFVESYGGINKLESYVQKHNWFPLHNSTRKYRDAAHFGFVSAVKRMLKNE